MYFHIGQDYLLNSRELIGIFDLDTAGASRRTQDFFRRAQQEGAVVDLCGPGTVPRSFLLTDFPDQTVYLSPLSPRALRHRGEERSDKEGTKL